MQGKEMGNFTVMRKMITLVLPLSGYMVLAVVLGVIGFLCAIFIPVGAVYAILMAMGEISGITFTQVFLFLMMIAVLRGILHYGEQQCNHYIAFKLLALIRDKVFRVLRILAPAKLEGKEKGNLISIITSDIELLEVFYAHTISPILIAVLTSVILLTIFYQFHPFIALLAFIAYLCVGIVYPMIITKLGKKQGNNYRKKFGELSSYTLESLRGMQDILQYHIGEERLQEMKDQSEQLNVIQKKMKGYEGLSSSLGNLAVLGFSFLMLFLSIAFFQQQIISFSDMVLSTVLLFSSFGPVLALSALSNNLLVTLASGRRVLSLLAEQPQVQDIIGKPAAEFDVIKASHISFAYDQEEILKDMSAVFEKGKITGIHGKSGSGKSTLLKLMMRFFDVQKGNIDIGNTHIQNINTKNLRDMESFVTQETCLFHDSIENNIKIANLHATHEQVVEACKKASIHDFITSLPNGYATKVSELGDSLSGGEKQRIAIARAFLHDSPCILLDEPTSNLDALNESVILKSLHETKDKTIILVSHRDSTMKIADTIIQMKEGRVS